MAKCDVSGDNAAGIEEKDLAPNAKTQAPGLSSPVK